MDGFGTCLMRKNIAESGAGGQSDLPTLSYGRWVGCVGDAVKVRAIF
jgi:hypothetical protein